MPAPTAVAVGGGGAGAAAAGGAAAAPAAGPRRLPPRDCVHACSWLSGGFMSRLVYAAARGTLDEAQLLADESVAAEAAAAQLAAAWADEQARPRALCCACSCACGRARPAAAPQLRRALWRAFRGEVLTAAAYKLGWGFFVLLCAAFFVRRLLDYVTRRAADDVHTAEEAAEGYLVCVFFFIAALLMCTCLQQMAAVSGRLGARVAAAAATAVYRKSLVEDRERSQAGDDAIDVLSLVSTDCTKLGEACTSLQYLWSGVVEATAIICVLIGFVGQAALPGLGALLLLVPLQFFIGQRISANRKNVVRAADARVSLMDEVLRAIKLVKMYVWEARFAARVAVLRGEESRLARVSGAFKSVLVASVFWLPPAIALAIFGVHALEEPLQAVLAFTTLSLFNTLRLPLVQLPKGLRAAAEAGAALQRLQKYLTLPERPARTLSPAPGFALTGASYAYGSGTAPLLHKITLAVDEGALVMVAGGVGSGKSNLVAAMLGRMTRVAGDERLPDVPAAYVPQTPWCAHGTVRENILFGAPFDEARYRRVIFACALEQDLRILEAGDLTEVGERGCALSGGQRQRVALARAAYSRARLVLLDSPLSAVDAYTAQHIFRHCIQGLMLRGEVRATVVLVTHQIELFAAADVLVVMDKGAAVHVGPYTPAVARAHFPTAVAEPDADEALAAALQLDVGTAAAHGSAASGSGRSPAQAPAPAPATPLLMRGDHSRSLAAGGVTPPARTSRSSSGSAGYVLTDADTLLLPQSMEAAAAAAAAAAAPDDALNTRGRRSERAMSLRADVLKALDVEAQQKQAALTARLGDGAGGSGGGEGDPAVPKAHVVPLPPPGLQLLHSSPPPLHPGAPAASAARTLSRGTGGNASFARMRAHSAGGGGGSSSAAAAALAAAAASAVGPSSDLPLVLPDAGADSTKSRRPPPPEPRPVNGYWALLLALWPPLALISLALFVATQICRIYSDIYISVWVAGSRGQAHYTAMYAIYVLVFLVLLLARGLFWYWIAGAAASRLHTAMFDAIIRAPMSYFSVTPLGRLLSVFSRDMDQIDEALQDNVMMVTIYLMVLLTTLGVVIRVLPYMGAVGGVLLIAFVILFYFYVRTSSVLKSIAGRAQADVVAHVAETLQGLAVVHAYRAEARFCAMSAAKWDRASSAAVNIELLQLWLAARLDFIGCLMVLATCLLAIASEPVLNASTAGLAVSNSFQILLFWSVMCRTASDIEGNIVSVERVKQLSLVAPEVGPPLTHDSCPPDDWPTRGEITFHNVVMSYLPAGPHVLKGVSFTIRPAERIGVAGRTGAGKSSLIMALYRLAVPSEGCVRVDGIDVAALHLSELRRRIAIIPQEPVMFAGTVRSNLDPFGEHDDAALVRVLERAALPQLAGDLGARVETFGGNLSLGVQQLVCLARAMLNQSRVLLLDEATAALDLANDALVQKVLRTEFADRTVVTIAHRLDTIIDSDRVLIMDQGRVAEFAPPHELLAMPDSIFSQLCRQTGAQYEALRTTAQRHYETMRALQDKLALADLAAETTEAPTAPLPPPDATTPTVTVKVV